jgi:hypothetical protein
MLCLWDAIVDDLSASNAPSASVGANGEGDTSTHWFRSQDACFEAITAEGGPVRRPG